MGDRHTLGLKGQSVADMDQVGAAQARKVIEWEYNVRVPSPSVPVIDECTQLGKLGWELCAAVVKPYGVEFIYKRRKQS